MTGFYVIIRGPLGCGKTTIAKKLAKQIKAKYFSVDAVLDQHDLTKEREAGYISQKSFIKANEIMITKAKPVLNRNKTVIIEGNFYWKSQIKNLTQRLGFPHYVFTLKAPLKTCIERDENRRKSIGQDAVKAVYKKSTEFDAGITINVNQPVTQCVKEIRSYLPLK